MKTKRLHAFWTRRCGGIELTTDFFAHIIFSVQNPEFRTRKCGGGKCGGGKYGGGKCGIFAVQLPEHIKKTYKKGAKTFKKTCTKHILKQALKNDSEDFEKAAEAIECGRTLLKVAHVFSRFPLQFLTFFPRFPLHFITFLSRFVTFLTIFLTCLACFADFLATFFGAGEGQRQRLQSAFSAPY